MKKIKTNELTTMIVGQATHEGETGKNNEDSGDFFAFLDRDDAVIHLGVVADGIGGSQAGERASTTGVAVVDQYFQQAAGSNLLQHLEKAFQTANTRIVDEGKRYPQFRGMGTTMTAAAIVKQRLWVANVGDSRAYLIRDGEIYQLTVDHTWAQEAIEAGRLTPEQAKEHPNRNVIKRYMGIQQDMEVDFRLKPPGDGGVPAVQNQGLGLKPGDVVLLCSDGLSDMVDDAQILAAVSANAPQAAAEKLVNLARAAGGYDNITVVAMQVPGKKAALSAARLRQLAFIGGALLILAALVGAAAVFGLGLLGSDQTSTPTLSATSSATSSATPSVTPSATPSAMPSATSSPTDTGTPAPTGQATPTGVPTRTPTPTPTPTNTPRPSTPTPTESPTATQGPGQQQPQPTSPTGATAVPQPPPPEPTPTR